MDDLNLSEFMNKVLSCCAAYKYKRHNLNKYLVRDSYGKRPIEIFNKYKQTENYYYTLCSKLVKLNNFYNLLENKEKVVFRCHFLKNNDSRNCASYLKISIRTYFRIIEKINKKFIHNFKKL